MSGPSFPSGSDGKESSWNMGDQVLIPRLGRSLPIPIFLPGKFYGQRDLADYILQKVRYNWATNTFTLGFPGSSAGKESVCNAGGPGSIPGLGRGPGEGISYPLQYSLASLVAQLIKNLPAIQETWVQSLGWEDPLEEGWQLTPVFLPGESPWAEEPGGLQSMGCKESDTTEHVTLPWYNTIKNHFDGRRVAILYDLVMPTFDEPAGANRDFRMSEVRCNVRSINGSKTST